MAENCCDKNAAIAEVSIKLLAKLIENLGINITKLKPETLQKVMKALTFLLDGKRQNTKNWALEICMYVFNLIGSQNYLNLMVYVLTPEEVQVIDFINTAHVNSHEPEEPKNKQIEHTFFIDSPKIEKEYDKATDVIRKDPEPRAAHLPHKLKLPPATTAATLVIDLHNPQHTITNTSAACFTFLLLCDGICAQASTLLWFSGGWGRLAFGRL